VSCEGSAPESIGASWVSGGVFWQLCGVFFAHVHLFHPTSHCRFFIMHWRALSLMTSIQSRFANPLFPRRSSGLGHVPFGGSISGHTAAAWRFDFRAFCEARISGSIHGQFRFHAEPNPSGSSHVRFGGSISVRSANPMFARAGIHPCGMHTSIIYQAGSPSRILA
jgi:hypothetical protein